jgi:myosin heavy subunit
MFDSALVVTQLRYTGLLETVRIRKAGFPSRLPQAAFLARFYYLVPLKGFDLKETLLSGEKEIQINKERCLAIFLAQSIDTPFYQIGKTRVFLKLVHFNMLPVL